jgi:hypothetical protein
MKTRDNMSAVIEGLQRKHGLLAAYSEAIAETPKTSQRGAVDIAVRLSARRMRALLKWIKMPPDAATTPDAAKALGLHLAGYTYVEIAAELGCTPDEAYNLVRQALKAMKR